MPSTTVYGLEARLDPSLAEAGTPVWSYAKQEYDGPAPPPRRREAAAEPGDTYADPFGMGARPGSEDWLREPDGAAEPPADPAVATRIRDLAEALDRHEEGLGTDTVERLALAETRDEDIIAELQDLLGSRERAAAARPAPGQAGLPGFEPRDETRQAIADLQRRKDAVRSGELVDGGIDGGLFSEGRARQKDIADLLNPNPPGDRTAATKENLHGEERQGQGRRQEGLLNGGAAPETGRPMPQRIEELWPARDSGDFGPIYRQFHHDAPGAVEYLLRQRTGEAVGALHHAEIGDIDLVWGKEGTGASDGYGLAKLAKWHPEVLGDLQGVLGSMRVVQRGKNRVRLESPDHKAAVRLDWDGKTKNWLLTAYEKERSGAGTRTDTAGLGSQGDTARLAAGSDSSISQVEAPRARYDDRSLDLFAEAQAKTDQPLVVDLTHADRVPEKSHSAATVGRGGDAREVPGQAAGLVRLGPHVAHVPVSELRSGIGTIESAEEAAHVVAGLRKQAQEHLAVVVTDANGKVLRVFQHAIGDRTAAPANAGSMAAAALNTPGVGKVWMAHNHPSGSLVQSDADRAAVARMRELLDGSGVEFQGGLVVGPGDLASLEIGPDLPVKLFPIAPHPRTQGIPLMGRELRGSRPGPAIETPQAMSRTLREMPDEDGLLLLDSQNQPTGWLPLDSAEMAFLRQGRGGPSARLLAAVDATNASGFAAKLGQPLDSREAAEAMANLKAFADKAGLAFLDLADRKGNLWTSRFGEPTTSQATFYANPFLPAALDLAKDIGTDVWRYPKQAAARAALGAAAGAGLSDDETGSGKWWADVAKGALAAEALAVRIPALGRAIEHLPLMGRGPLDLRQLKRRQQNMRAILDRQTAEVGTFLKKHFTPSERAMMADLIENKGIVPDLNLIHRQAAELDAYLSYAGAQMRRLGMLPADQELGGYLHRYYDKHLDAVLALARNKPWRGSCATGAARQDPPAVRDPSAHCAHCALWPESPPFGHLEKP